MNVENGDLLRQMWGSDCVLDTRHSLALDREAERQVLAGMEQCGLLCGWKVSRAENSVR